MPGHRIGYALILGAWLAIAGGLLGCGSVASKSDGGGAGGTTGAGGAGGAAGTGGTSGLGGGPGMGGSPGTGGGNGAGGASGNACVIGMSQVGGCVLN